jgi:hypothetical protein
MAEREPPRPPSKQIRATIIDSGWTGPPPPLQEEGETSETRPKRGLPPLPEPSQSPLAGVLPELPDAPFPPLSDPEIKPVPEPEDDDGDVISSIPPARALPGYADDESTLRRELIVTRVDDQIQNRIRAMRDASSPDVPEPPAKAPSLPPPPPSARAVAARPESPPAPPPAAPPIAAPGKAPTRSSTVLFGPRLPVPEGAPVPPAPESEPLTQPLSSAPATVPAAPPTPAEPVALGAAPAAPVDFSVFAASSPAPLPVTVERPEPLRDVALGLSETPAPTFVTAVTQRVRFAGGEIPLWNLLSPVVLLVALAAAFIGAAVAGPSEPRASAGSEPVASASGPGTAPPAAAPLADPTKLGRLERAVLGDEAALKELEAKPSSEQTFEEAVALAQGLGAREQRGARELRDRLARDPGLAKDAKILADLRRYVDNPQTAPDALAAMAQLPGPLGADMLYEIWTGTVGRTAATELAQTLVLSKNVQEKASPALKAALDLRAAESCDAAKGVLSQAAEHGDRRCLSLLTKLNRRFGCGPGKRQDCYPCLREGDDLERAIKAVRARREPKPFGR